MKRELFIVEEDKTWARQRVAELERAILELGPEFQDVFTQSSETWHDNAPFDALRDRQSLLDAELQSLRSILRDSVPGLPKTKANVAGIGALVTVQRKDRALQKYEIAGDWTYRAGQAVGDRVVISTAAPVAQELLGKKVGDETKVGTVLKVEYEKA